MGGEGWWWLRGGYAAKGRKIDEKWGKMGVLSLGEGLKGTDSGQQRCLINFALQDVGRLFLVLYS